MTVRVVVVDYGIGNVYSVSRALERCGAEVLLTDDAGSIEASPRVVLPGVGAFADGMRGLRERALVEPLRRYAASGRPLLGICLGMQMLATVSEEFGLHEGLKLIPGRVVPVPPTTTEGLPHKIPLIGWSGLMPAQGALWSESVLRDTAAATPVYLVHSYHLIPDDAAHMLAHCMYGGHRITTAVCRGAVIGCQFHPEKSGEAGLAILARFLQN